MFKTKRQIQSIKAREILDSRGNPTVEAVVILNDGSLGRACAPSGASTGKHERAELRDHDPSRYLGKGVQKAVDQIYHLAAPALIGCSVSQQQSIDQRLLSLIDPDSEQGLASNVLLPLSLACAKAAASSYHLPLYRYLGGAMSNTPPMPMMNLLNGGAHASNNLDIQEFMVIPVGAQNISQAIEWCSRIHHRLGELLCEKGLSCGVGDEGGFAPDVKDTREVFRYLQKAVEKAGYHVGDDVVFAMDAAASELYDEEAGVYIFPGESRAAGKEPEEGAGEGSAKDYCKDSVKRSADEMIALYEELIEEFPIVSIEDGLFEDDWEGWQKMTKRIGGRVQLVGDDLFVTNPKRIKCGIDLNVANAVLIKVNQIGTVTEAMEAIEMAKCAGYQAVISHRSGETEDAFIADLAVAVNAGQIKTGAPCRGERTAKYNQLLRIEEELKESARYGKAEIIRKK